MELNSAANIDFLFRTGMGEIEISPLSLAEQRKKFICTVMVKSNIMRANDLATLLAEDIPNHKS